MHGLPATGLAVALSLVAVAARPALAQSGAGGHGSAHGAAHVTVASQTPASASPAPTSANDPGGVDDRYAAWKDNLANQAGIGFDAPVSVFVQGGTPNGGPAVAALVYAPTISWKPFTDTPIGSGLFTFSFQGDQFWTGANSGSQQARMGLLTAPNDWSENLTEYLQITYTHTLPGDWLAVSVGQYSFAQYDGNEYAGNAQTNFVNYALAQNGTQTYANAGVGAFAQVTPPNTALQFAGGFQGATDIAGSAVTTSGLGDGSIAYFAAAQWTPAILGGGSYGVLYYTQPAVPQQPSRSQGISFSAVQNLDARFGVFLRANNASGDAMPIETSVAFGGIVNDPFGRNQMDQAGIGVAWSKTNLAVVAQPARRSEQIVELYSRFTFFKALQVTPDVQLVVDPALAPQTGLAAVFTLRTTINF